MEDNHSAYTIREDPITTAEPRILPRSIPRPPVSRMTSKLMASFFSAAGSMVVNDLVQDKEREFSAILKSVWIGKHSYEQGLISQSATSEDI